MPATESEALSKSMPFIVDIGTFYWNDFECKENIVFIEHSRYMPRELINDPRQLGLFQDWHFTKIRFIWPAQPDPHQSTVKSSFWTHPLLECATNCTPADTKTQWRSIVSEFLMIDRAAFYHCVFIAAYESVLNDRASINKLFEKEVKPETIYTHIS